MKCRHCKNNIMDLVIDLGCQPPSNSYLTKIDLNKKENYFPLKIFICSSCFLVQTEDTTDKKTFFNSNYAYFSSTSKTWLEHAKQYATKIVDEFKLDQNSFVLEIASNDGYLLKNFKEMKIPCLGIEPTESTAQKAQEIGINTYVEFFDLRLAKKITEKFGKADLIVCNNVYAHVPDINDFTKAIEKSLKDDAVVTLEFPHLLNLIQKCQFDTMYHEHYSYLSVKTVKQIFEKHNLRVFKAEKIPTHGGSVRIYGCRKNANFQNKQSVGKIISEEIKAGLFDLLKYKEFQKNAEKIKLNFQNFLMKAKADLKKVCAYGAAAKGNTLINYAEVDSDLIPFVADASDAKANKYLPGSRIPIRKPESLIEFEPDYVIILPWNLANEIKSQFSKLADQGCKFFTVVPEVKEI